MLRIWEYPISERSSPIDFNGVRSDLDKKHWCKSNHLTQSSMGAKMFNLGDSLFLYTGSEPVRNWTNAAFNGYLELTLLKGHQRFSAISTSNLKVYKVWDWWIFTLFIFEHHESLPCKIWSTVNLERTGVLLFYHFVYLKENFDLEKTNQLGESSPNFIFAAVNLDLIIIEKRWTDGESWDNDFVEKVIRGEDLRWVGSRCPLTRA